MALLIDHLRVLRIPHRLLSLLRMSKQLRLPVQAIPLTLIAPLFLSGCGSTAPSTTTGKAPARTTSPGWRGPCYKPATSKEVVVPVEFTTQAPNTTIVQACVGRRGPFPFIVDTGATGTLISRSVASRLGLRPLGPPASFGSEGCRGSTQPVRLPPLQVGERVIAPSTGYTIGVKGFGGPGEPVGTLGVNALSSLGPIKLDYLGRQLLIGPRGRKDSHEPHSASHGIPSRWLSQKAQIVAPLTVLHRDGNASLRVEVSFHGGEAHEWIPDTGSQTSIVDSTSVSASHLRYAPGSEDEPSLCSNRPLTVRGAWSGRWELSGHHLPPELLQVSSVSRTVGVDGVLGGSTFVSFGSVIFDWPDHLLFLGAR